MLHPGQGSLVGFIPELTVQVMNEDLLPENRKEVDDQDPKLHYSEGWHHETDNQNFSNGTESWSSFNQVTDEEGKLPQTGSVKASFLAWIGLLGLGFLGGRVKFARRKS